MPAPVGVSRTPNPATVPHIGRAPRVDAVTNNAYFVANAGSDANAGTSSGAPYQTIAKAVGVAVAGDTILLNRGDVFREGFVVGVNSLSVDAYGSGVRPVIDGSLRAASGSWTNYAAPTGNLLTGGDFETFDSANVPHGWTSGGTTTAITQSTLAGGIQDGTHCCLLNGNTAACSISQTVTAAGGATLTFSFWHLDGGAPHENQPYSVQVVGGTSNGLFLQGGGTWGAPNALTYLNTSPRAQTSTTFTLPGDATGVTVLIGVNVGGTGTFAAWVDAADLSGTTATTIYSQTLASLTAANTTACWVDDTNLLLAAASLAAMTAGSCFATGTTFYVWLSDSSNPSGHTVDALTTAGQFINNSSHSGFSFKNVAVRHVSNNAIWMFNSPALASQTLTGCELGPSTGQPCILAIDSASVVSGNYTHHNWNGLAYGAGGDGAALMLTTGTDNPSVHHNISYLDFEGIRSENTPGAITSHHNLIVKSLVNCHNYEGGTSGVAQNSYNNTIHHQPSSVFQSGHGLDTQLQNAGPVWRNNIVYSDYAATNTNVELFALGSAGSAYSPHADIDYDCGYLAPGSTSSYGKLNTTAYADLATFKAALIADGNVTGFEAHGFSSDPLFQDVSTGKYTLGSSSPCLAGGTTVAAINTTTTMGAYIPPTVTGATPVGSTLTAIPDTYPGTYTVAYQWTRDGATIGGATSPTYVTVTADGGHNIGCTVTITQDVSPVGGGAMASSNTINAQPVSAPTATAAASAATPAPQLQASPPPATASASSPTPGAALQILPSAATASASAPTPTVSASGANQTVSPPAATASASAVVPAIQLQTVTPAATASATSPTPTPQLVVLPAAASASASAPLPGTVGNRLQLQVPAPPAFASASALLPTITTLLAAPVATSTAAALTPTITNGVSVIVTKTLAGYVTGVGSTGIPTPTSGRSGLVEL